jgi:hypothetical protein
MKKDLADYIYEALKEQAVKLGYSDSELSR